MDEMRFGEILRQTRERKGLDFNATARRLRIRPDILRAIEAGDFAAMPPQGYSRNMITGYARFLGLDPRDITERYFAEVRAYETGASTAQQRKTALNKREPNQNTRSSYRGSSVRTSQSESRRVSQPNRQTTQRRTSQPSRYDQNRYETGSYEQHDTRRRTASSGRPNERRYPTSDPRQRRTQSSTRTQDTYLNFNGGRQPRGGIMTPSYIDQGLRGYSNINNGTTRRLPFIIAAAVVLVIVIVVCIILFAGKSSASTSVVSTMPVTGVSNSSRAAGESATSSSSSAPKAPTEGKAEISVEQDRTPYLEIYVDDTTVVAEEVSGPKTYSYTFTDKFKFVCVREEGVSLTVNGVKQKLEPSDQGVVTNEYTFEDILKQWQDENGVSSSSRSSLNSSSSASSRSSD